MATKPNISSTGPGPQHFFSPNARELRVQSVHRLQIGLLGLAVMLLIVGLANIVMERVKLSDRASVSQSPAAAATPTENSDPLAVIGVVPSPDPGASRAASQPRR